MSTNANQEALSMATDQAIEQTEAYWAWRGGRIVQVHNAIDQTWNDLKPYDILYPHYILRRKPQPKLRRWKPSEIPVGALIRIKGNALVNLILSRDSAGFKICTHGCEPILVDVLASQFRFEDYELSKDFGATWQPCGVVES